MKIIVTKGIGEERTNLAAFDRALISAGVANYNLITLSSVIPPDSEIVEQRYTTPPEDYGKRLYVVMSRQQTDKPGMPAIAGVGWTQDPDTGAGLFVEIHGSNRQQVEQEIQDSLETMIVNRRGNGHNYGEIHSEVAEVYCFGKPVCALVIAVYKTEDW